MNDNESFWAVERVVIIALPLLLLVIPALWLWRHRQLCWQVVCNWVTPLFAPFIILAFLVRELKDRIQKKEHI